MKCVFKSDTSNVHTGNPWQKIYKQHKRDAIDVVGGCSDVDNNISLVVYKTKKLVWCHSQHLYLICVTFTKYKHTPHYIFILKFFN